MDTSQLIASNFEDWNMAEQKFNKIKRKLEKDKETQEINEAEIVKVKVEEEPVSVFQV